MDFSLNDEQIAFRDTIRRFVDETVTPAVPALEADPRFPRELFAEVGKLDMKVEDNKVIAYRARVKVSFKYED